MMLVWTIPVTFAAALAVLLLPQRLAGTARWLALAGSVAGLLLALAGTFGADGGGPWRTLVRWEWIPALGISLHLAADGISALLALLTALIAVTGVLFSWRVRERPRFFFACFLVIIGGVYGVFFSADLVLFFLFYEIVIVPKYLLIAGWGSTRREYAAMKLTVYSVAGSALVLLGILALPVAAGIRSFDLVELQQAFFPGAFQLWAFPVLFLGFGILAGLWPFHTWAPTGHTAAPTAASMLLAGVVMKLGAYGALRIAMPLLPEGLEAWRLAFAALAVAGILLAALAALAQRDLKYVVAYSSVSHMGFVLLGLMTLDLVGVTGAVLQMFSHGVIAGLLFAVVGTMVYERTHTRDLAALGGMQLRRSLPVATVFFLLGSAASMGMPGFSGFIAELSVLLGAWRAFPWLVLAGILGVLLVGAFSLRALQLGFFAGEPDRNSALLPDARAGYSSGEASAAATKFAPPGWHEVVGGGILVAVALWAGLYPQPFLELIQQSLLAEPLRMLVGGGGAAP